MTLNDDPYRFLNQRLQPRMASEIVLHLFNGRMVETEELINQVKNYHIDRGGYPGKQSPRNIVSKALAMLRLNGEAENPSRGNWRMRRIADGDENIANSSESVYGDSEQDPDVEEMQPLNTTEKDYRGIEITNKHGVGTGAVYLYYFPSHRRLYEGEGKANWPCKIGKHKYNDVVTRILEQGKTSWYEYPKVEFVLFTDDEEGVERLLHTRFKANSQWITEAPGNEWFLTSPVEVLEVAKFLFPNVFESVTTQNLIIGETNVKI